MSKMESATTKVKLNIAMKYPVQWSRYEVMRDYIQNFFDAVGPEQFQEKFEYRYENMTLTMSAPEGFDKKWLFFMGTSTKRNTDAVYAGKFGEGFKVASLVAYRDLKLKICMESRDWRLEVTEVTDTIEGTPVSFLAYEISEREYEDNAILTLKGVDTEQYDSFLLAMKSFYYKGNPRFGEMISCGENYAVYHSNTESHKTFGPGYLYVSYQERKDFGLPIIICHHTYVPNADDRDREEFSSRETLWCIKEVIDEVSPSEAMAILEAISICWRGGYLKNVYFNTKFLIQRLIHKILEEQKIKRLFIEKYREKLVADFNSTIPKDRKKIALLWYRRSEYYNNRRVVLNRFAELGIVDLEQLCEQNKGFQIYAKPKKRERRYIRILEEAAREILGDILSYNTLPQCEIVLNSEAALDGCAITRKVTGKKKEKSGLRVERVISKVHLQGYLLKEECFSEAFSVYAHELLHQYGGDESIQFHKALLMMNKRIIERAECFDKYESRWREIA